MPKLLYSAILSLDGYIEDESGQFGWAEPDPEVHQFINDQERTVGTYLYGRRMYETMKGWETDPGLAQMSPAMADYARLWQAAGKIVYSTTLDQVSTARTRMERTFDPAALHQWKESAERDLSIGGPGLAAHAFAAELVDELHRYLVPYLAGGGKPGLPGGVNIRLELLETKSFDGGFAYLGYRVLN
jgi:dihydrofolate reductase